MAKDKITKESRDFLVALHYNFDKIKHLRSRPRYKGIKESVLLVKSSKLNLLNLNNE